METPKRREMESEMYSVTLDGVIDESFASKSDAEAAAKWLRRHPAVIDRRIFGNGGVVEVVEVLDQNNPNVCIHCGVRIEDCECIDNW
jgi:hypothetical protein